MHNGHTVQFNLIWFPEMKNGERITFTKKQKQKQVQQNNTATNVWLQSF